MNDQTDPCAGRGPVAGRGAGNAAIADRLREMAALLEAQGEDNTFRVAAYRHAADTVARWPTSVSAVFEQQGLAGLDAMPAIGAGIAAAIAEIVQTGRWERLERLRGAAEPEAVFRVIPGIGARLALRLREELGIETLEALEVAAHDGRLERMPGLGPRRTAAIRAAVTQLLDRARATRRPHGAPPEGEAPGVGLLLDVDREYREGAGAGRLPTIAPRRFNPQGEAWLPVLHTARGDWAFTALYSNTARAHELGRVHDWVVVYAEDRQHHERRYTVVTEHRGPLAGQRVVRGREDECGARGTP